MNTGSLLSFSQDQLIAIMNHEFSLLGKKLNAVKVNTVDDGLRYFVCDTDRGARYVAILSDVKINHFQVRSLAKIKAKNKPFGFLINGCTGKNLESIKPFSLGSEDLIYCNTKEKIEQYYKETNIDYFNSKNGQVQVNYLIEENESIAKNCDELYFDMARLQ